MGGGGSKSEQRTDNSTKTTTTTTTTIGDIGLTGDAAVALAGILGETTLGINELSFESFGNVAELQSKSFAKQNETFRDQQRLANATLQTIATIGGGSPVSVGGSSPGFLENVDLQKAAVLLGGAAVLVTLLKD